MQGTARTRPLDPLRECGWDGDFAGPGGDAVGDGRERKGERGDLRGSDADAPADERGPSRRRGHHERKAHRRAARLADEAARAERKAEKAARRAWRESERRRRRDEKRSRVRARNEREYTPEEREHYHAVKRARRRANQRMGFVTHAVSYAATLGLLMVTTRSVRVVLIVALAWGIGLFCHYFWALAAPRVRDRWVEQEVGARSRTKVRRERRQVETRSRRSMEDLSASIAHEIRNPITAAKSLVQQMGEDPASD